jgi:glutamate racemase
VIGAVEPGAARAIAATHNGHIGVIGTLATVRSSAYVKAIGARAPHATVTTAACPLLVPLAEEGWTDDEIARLVARRYLGPLFAADPQIDALVLGCTHYPLLREVLTRAAHELAHREVVVVDSASAGDGGGGARGGGGCAESPAAGGRHCFATDTSRLEELAPLSRGIADRVRARRSELQTLRATRALTPLARASSAWRRRITSVMVVAFLSLSVMVFSSTG